MILLWFLIYVGLMVLPFDHTNGLLQSNSNSQEECPEHFKCLDLRRNNDHLQQLKINSTLPNWYELCNCDDNCHMFGDCCQDSPIIDRLKLDEWTFVRIRFGSKINFLSLMKNRCPEDWQKNELIRHQCENSYFDPVYDFLLPEMEQYLLIDGDEEFKNWHVTSRKTMITYRNLYCSICNNDTETDAWTQRLMCQDLDSRCTAINRQTAPEILGKEKLKRTPLQNKVYSGCNLGWYKMNFIIEPARVLFVVKKCLIYYAPVVVKDPRSKKFVVFKNKFCAECNNFEEQEMQCASSAVDQTTQVPASFNLIAKFDTNYLEGSVIDENEDKRCPPRTIFNPITGFCQEVFGDIRKHLLLKFSNSSPRINQSNLLLLFLLSVPTTLIFIKFYS